MPQVGVGGILLEGQRVLLVKRGAPPGQGLWSIPGGKVREGETLKAACEREMREETGLWVEAGPLVEVVELMDDRFHYVILDFLVHLRGGSLKAGGDAVEARWFAIRDLPRLPTTRGLEAVVRKALKAHPKEGKGPP